MDTADGIDPGDVQPDPGAGDLCCPELPADVESEVDLIEPELPIEMLEEDLAPQPCELDYDCEPGESCTLGFCGPFVRECDDEMDCPEGETCLEGVCLEEGMSPLAGKVVFNEVLADGAIFSPGTRVDGSGF